MANAAKLSKQLLQISASLGLTYSFRGKSIPAPDVFSATGLLPGLVRRADQLCALCLGYGLGAHVEEVEGALLGKRVTFDEVTPDVLRYLFILDVLMELKKVTPAGDAIRLDDLVYE